jgi:DNA helicase-2/ATP-dependent DNA helicase PcrA
MEFPARYPETKMFRLELNYRSAPEILNLANDTIEKNQYQFQKTLTATRPSMQWNPAVVPLRDGAQQAEFIAQRILELMDEGIAPTEIAVLYRAHFHAMELELELTRRGIPYVIHSGIRFFEQRHIKDVLSYLRVLVNPYEELSWRRVLLLIPGIGPRTADRIWSSIRKEKNPISQLGNFQDQIPRASHAGWRQFVELMQELSHEGFLDAPSAAIDHVLKNGYDKYLESKFPDAVSRREDVNQMGSFAMQFDSLSRFLSELSLLGQMEGDESEEETGKERVRLSTIHQAKGLEWKAVFVMYLVDGRFPSTRSMKKTEDLEEERRLFYVASTRAKDHLYLTYVLLSEGFYQAPNFYRPSVFLKELKREHYDLWQVDDSLIPDAGLPEFIQDDAGKYFQ